MSDEMPAELALFAHAYRDELELDFVDVPPAADLADVFARARLLEGATIPEGLHAELELDADADADDADDDGEDVGDPALDLFAAALREDVEGDAEQRTARPIAVRRPKPVRAWVAAVVAVAAVLLGSLSLAQVAPSLATVDTSRLVAQASSQTSVRLADIREHQIRQGQNPASRKPVRNAGDTEVVEVPEPPAPASEELPEVSQAEMKRQALSGFESEASDAWERGDLARAESMLRKVIARGGRTTRAELAYGDLFSVARQRGGVAAQARVWHEYLRRFPRGRYSDDARAGLCLRAGAAEQEACWVDYLARHPRGAHVERARRSIGKAAPL